MDVLLPELREINSSMAKVAKETTTMKGMHQKENDALSMSSVLRVCIIENVADAKSHSMKNTK